MAVNDTPVPVVGPCLSVCGPNELKAIYPCLHCLSKTQLEQIWLYLWAYFGNTTPLAAMECSGCLTCMSEKDMLEAKVALFAEFLGVTTQDFETVIEAIKCLQCYKPQQIRAATLALICAMLKEIGAL